MDASQAPRARGTCFLSARDITTVRSKHTAAHDRCPPSLRRPQPLCWGHGPAAPASRPSRLMPTKPVEATEAVLGPRPGCTSLEAFWRQQEIMALSPLGAPRSPCRAPRVLPSCKPQLAGPRGTPTLPPKAGALGTIMLRLQV